MLIGIDASRANKEHKIGTEWYAYYLIRNFAKIDSKNQYILYTDKPLGPGLADLINEENDAEKSDFSIAYDKQGFQIIKSPYNNFKAKVLKWPYKNFWTLGRLSLECFVSAPNVLFIPSHTLPLIHPRKSMVTIHDIGFMRNRCLYRHEPIGPEGKKTRLLTNIIARLFTFGKYSSEATDYLHWSTDYTLRKAKKVITVSNGSRADILSHYHVSEKKIQAIYNGYNEKKFKAITDRKILDSVLDKYGIKGPYIFYSGKIEKKKNIPALIEAFAIMRDRNPDIKHKLVLAGDAFYGYDEAHYIISEYNLDDEVLLPGWINENDMPYIYSGANAFVFPSNYEAFGTSLLEAMACGLPICASDISSIPEVLQGAGLLFDPCDIYSIAEAMKEILTDEHLREELIKSGYERVKDFSWRKCAEETLAVINGL
ncbi:MAG: Glycosyl transferase group 1 [Candidatus Falkowbacteria bacterium GW2011_GWC2_38_22]|uniref:Glycosyl transferase group 1 n=1 Tax=Candidatus Falkowbacteria bacterium GW2011_GWE1_38_31 TaxID=1618638 RepID=A0A0G0N0Q6_9BACT|nr:MAG: Glycosyl transferase group 1 [Candidatus Falkowbacteria bacterium GW2011_GWF2_38_1205]KKQ62022.1 MAG: Glycosyl transferase group 1 [Candidatus Falkowbacteria bacterium GW2011_GWC2_38_22]KKQ63816.1 MAG: Glycosyl transferase group 1 [Candidatus Falkowbacteria bacterium GW2011_GWF1_38_22]KKQ66073.1 MAG: Glycosyl transferase group 1 [Candidatus Falkowbacteria bacterium GW2011_GWE2_38_254]KKQ70676.1 MAG: Glycosyl transferase group 1 [Candidatus Falkowbacteria bacterium GW2011_GWE1_38_31]KKQ